MLRTWSVALLWLLAMGAPARADVGVVVAGEATMQPALVAQLETWLKTHGHDLVSAPLPPDAINSLIDCFVVEDKTCARKVVEKRAKSQAVVFAQVNVQTGANALERTVILTAHWFDKGRDAVSERKFCEKCTDVTLRQTADELMLVLAGSGAKDAGRLKLTSNPPGARVLVKGKPIGTTPLEQVFAPGDHEVTIEHDGKQPEVRKISIRKDETTALDVQLRSEPSPTGRVGKLPFALLGAGVVLTATGVVLYAIDEDPSSVPTSQPRYLDSAPIGVPVMIGGIAVAAVGGYLLWRRTGASSTPVVAATPGGGFVGWSGRF